MKKILVLDGGGVMGAIQCKVLERLEEELGNKLCNEFDLIVGTSVGAIIGGIISTGNFKMKYISEIIIEQLPNVFKKNPWYKKYKYDKNNVKSFYDKLLFDTKMKDLLTKFVCTSVNAVDGKTHFFKSWEQKDGELQLYDAIERSFAAPYYFGPIVDEKTKSVWLDGGTGLDNSPILEAFIECVRQKWFKNEKIFMLSVGSGSIDMSQSFDEAKKMTNYFGLLKQILYYMKPLDGGLARYQATDAKCKLLSYLDNSNNDFLFHRIDKVIDTKINKIDEIQYLDKYINIGNELANNSIDIIIEKLRVFK